jgi:2-oxoisovalerate dehydrogenase E2 component (dihydrolipoyl transacylase)
MTDTVFTLPDLGEGLTEAELVKWLVRPGDTIAVDAPVAEVETAKAMVEVPSPFAGIVAELHGTEGSTIAVGAPLITVRPVESATAPPRRPPAADTGRRQRRHRHRQSAPRSSRRSCDSWRAGPASTRRRSWAPAAMG